MEEIVKHINDTNASFRTIGAGDANNTDLFLDNEHYAYFKDAGPKITVRFDKKNLTKAISFIASILPRKYDNSGVHKTIQLSAEFIYDQMAFLDAFFVFEGQKVEKRTQIWNARKDVPKKNGEVDNRFYFNGLLEDNVSYTNYQGNTINTKFTIRNYLAGGYSDLHFKKAEDNIFDVWVTNTLEPSYTERSTDILNSQETLLIEAKQLTSFVLSAVRYFDKRDGLNAIVPYTTSSQLRIKVSKEGAFSLTGMFVESTSDDIKDKNKNHRNWFEDLFKLEERTVLLSTQWNVPQYDNNGNKFQLSLPDFINMIQTCYGEYYVYKLGPNGEHQLWKVNGINDNNNHPLQKIYYGTPGSGKSHKVDSEVLNGVDDDFVFRTTFHPDSDYASFVGCYKPRMEDDQIRYEFTPQAFTQAYVKAWQNPDEQVYLVIEEINRGNCAQIFGDLFQLLDRKGGVSEYPINADADLRQYLENELGAETEGIENGKLKLPANLNILATMNTSDQSLFPMDSAFKRRWSWECVPIDYEHEKSSQFIIKIGGKPYKWNEFLNAVNQKIFRATDSEDKQMGNFFINGDVDERQFIDKVMFYLWNDICKEEYHTTNNFFRVPVEGDDAGSKEFSFNQLFGAEATTLLKGFMKYLDVKPIGDGSQSAENEEENASDGE